MLSEVPGRRPHRSSVRYFGHTVPHFRRSERFPLSTWCAGPQCGRFAGEAAPKMGPYITPAHHVRPEGCPPSATPWRFHVPLFPADLAVGRADPPRRVPVRRRHPHRPGLLPAPDQGGRGVDHPLRPAGEPGQGGGAGCGAAVRGGRDGRGRAAHSRRGGGPPAGPRSGGVPRPLRHRPGLHRAAHGRRGAGGDGGRRGRPGRRAGRGRRPADLRQRGAVGGGHRAARGGLRVAAGLLRRPGVHRHPGPPGDAPGVQGPRPGGRWTRWRRSSARTPSACT